MNLLPSALIANTSDVMYTVRTIQYESLGMLGYINTSIDGELVRLCSTIMAIGTPLVCD